MLSDRGQDFCHGVMVYFEQLFFSQYRKKRCGRGPRVPLLRAVLDILTCFFASIACVADNICGCMGSSGHFRELVRQ